MANRSVELVVGAFVALGVAALLVRTLQVSNLGALRRRLPRDRPL